jgi:hypothetical protein
MTDLLRRDAAARGAERQGELGELGLIFTAVKE